LVWCEWASKKWTSQLCTWSGKSNWAILSISVWWRTVSKALLKSKTITITYGLVRSTCVTLWKSEMIAAVVRCRYPRVSVSRHTMYLGHRRFRCRSWSGAKSDGQWSWEAYRLLLPRPQRHTKKLGPMPQAERTSLGHNIASTLQTLPVG